MRIQSYDEAENQENVSSLRAKVINLIVFALSLILFFVIPAIQSFSPVNFLALFSWNFSLWPIILGLPLFLWGIIGTINNSKWLKKEIPRNWHYRPGHRFFNNVWRSIVAGTVEELGHWGLLMQTILILVTLTNYFPTISGLFQTYIVFPGTIITLGLLNLLVTTPFGWMVAVGVLVIGICDVESHFQKDLQMILFHFYFGIYFAVVILTYGIFLTMAIHVTYDIILAIIKLYYRLQTSHQ